MNKNILMGLYPLLKMLLLILAILVVIILSAHYFLKTLGDDVIEQEFLLRDQMYIVDLYRTIGKYNIGKRNTGGGFGGPGDYYDTICDNNTKKCIKGKLRGVNQQGEVLYIYFNPLYPGNNELPNSYYVFEGGTLFDMRGKDFNDLKVFGIFTQESRKFYSLKELAELGEDVRSIFLELKRSPRFIYE